MTSSDQRKNHLPAIATTLVTQLAVLLVLCWAAVLYLNWSSDSAMAEFMAATKAPAAAAGEPHASIHPAHHRAALCPRGA